MASAAVQSTHFKANWTSAQIWKSLTSEYEKDVRSARFDLKKQFHNPVHDPSQPIATYIARIEDAADQLSVIGHTPSSTDITDSIIMHLDPSWHVIHTMLVTRPSNPSISELKGIL
ncbi:hypothetical protein PLICRDRAFT_110799, partial [Plicaturopsis crispa FD-325 SS-3]